MKSISLLLVGIVLTNYLVSSTKDCQPCPRACPFGNTFTKKNDACICSCAEDPCKKKNCPKQCRVEDKNICRSGNCLQIKVGVCYDEEQKQKPVTPTPKLITPIPKASFDSGYVEGQLRIVPSRIEIHEGDWTELKCELHDPVTDSMQPLHHVTWTRENAGHASAPLPSNFQVYGNVMRIENAREFDSGMYRCSASLRYETVHETVDVRVFPRMQRQHPQLYHNDIIYHQPASTTRMTTTTTTTPMPSQEHNNMIMLKNMRPLYNQHADPQNYGRSNYYDDEVKVYDNNNSPFVFSIELPEFPDPSVIPDIEIVGPKEIKVNEGGSAIVEFRVLNGGGSLRIGKYDDILPPGSKVEVKGDSYKLYLNNLRRLDKGYYTCTVTSKYGASERKAVMVHVGGCRPAKKTTTPTTPAPAPAVPFYYNPQPRVEDVERSRPALAAGVWPRATITKSGDILEATEGDSIKIRCNVLDAEQSYFSNLEEKLSVENLVTRFGNTLVLELNNLRESDSATYECMAENQVGTATDKIQVRVKPKEKDTETSLLPRASVIKTDDIQVLRQGDSFVIECVVERSNDVELSKGGAKMPESYKRTLENNVYKLNLFDLQPSDSGYYYCIATNEHGADRCWIYLDIQPRHYNYRVDRPQASAQVVEPTPKQKPPTPEWKPETQSEPQQKEDDKVLKPTNNVAASDGQLMVRINNTLPRLNNEMLELNLIEGQNVILECKVSNGLITKFKKYEGEPAQYAHEKFSGYERLIISNLSEQDAGYYICEAVNDNDANRDTLLISIQKRDY